MLNSNFNIYSSHHATKGTQELEPTIILKEFTDEVNSPKVFSFYIKWYNCLSAGGNFVIEKQERTLFKIYRARDNGEGWYSLTGYSICEKCGRLSDLVVTNLPQDYVCEKCK